MYVFTSCSGLSWVFVAVSGFSLVVARGYSLVAVHGLISRSVASLQSTGSSA